MSSSARILTPATYGGLGLFLHWRWEHGSCRRDGDRRSLAESAGKLCALNYRGQLDPWVTGKDLILYTIGQNHL